MPHSNQTSYLQHRSHKMSKDSLSSLGYGDGVERYGQIDEEDLFSFRTQEAASPMRRDKVRGNSRNIEMGTSRMIMYDSPGKT